MKAAHVRMVLAVSAVVALFMAIQTASSAQVDFSVDEVVSGPANTTQIAASPKYLAWSQVPAKGERSNLYVKPRGGERQRANPKGMQGSLGGFDGDQFIYQVFHGSVDNGRSQIRITNLVNGETRTPKHANSRHWDFWPSLSGRWVLFGRTNADQGKTRILLANLRTGRTITLDKAPSATYFQPGQVNGRYAVWVRWKSGEKATAFRYNRRTGKRTRIPTGDAYNWAPSVTRKGVVYFGRSGKNCGSRVKLLKWSKSTGVQRLRRFPDGIDVGDSYVTTNRAGRRELYYVRIDCSADGNGDAFKLLFGSPAPSPTPTVSPSATASPSTSPSTSPSPVGPTLTVEVVGEGTVTSDPEGIDCGDECAADFEAGTTVTLTASERIHWSHPNCNGRSDTCSFVINDDLTVTANF